VIDRRTPFQVDVAFRSIELPHGDLNVGIFVHNEQDVLAFATSWRESSPEPVPLAAGIHTLRCTVPAPLLNEGLYRITINVFRNGRLLFSAEEALGFEVQEGAREGSYFGRKRGVFRPQLPWALDPVDA
jgi:hypothetical protein